MKKKSKEFNLINELNKLKCSFGSNYYFNEKGNLIERCPERNQVSFKEWEVILTELTPAKKEEIRNNYNNRIAEYREKREDIQEKIRKNFYPDSRLVMVIKIQCFNEKI